MKIKKINKPNTDWIDSKGCIRPKFDVSSTILNKKWNSIIHFVSNEDVKQFEKINDQYIVTYKDDQVWKFKGGDLVERIELELQIILNNSNCKKVEHTIF